MDMNDALEFSIKAANASLEHAKTTIDLLHTSRLNAIAENALIAEMNQSTTTNASDPTS